MTIPKVIEWMFGPRPFVSILGESTFDLFYTGEGEGIFLKPGECERAGKLQAERFIDLILSTQDKISWDKFYYLLRLFDFSGKTLFKVAFGNGRTYETYKHKEIPYPLAKSLCHHFMMEMYHPRIIRRLSSQR